MRIRQGTVQEMQSLWKHTRATLRFFSENIHSGNAEFWTIEKDSHLIGELYFFKRLSDADFANGKRRGYLCAFRIAKEHRGLGYGTKLLMHVLEHADALGFAEITIGVEETEPANLRLYNRLGFTRQIKRCVVDPCDVDEQFMPIPCVEFLLLMKAL